MTPVIIYEWIPEICCRQLLLLLNLTAFCQKWLMDYLRITGIGLVDRQKWPGGDKNWEKLFERAAKRFRGVKNLNFFTLLTYFTEPLPSSRGKGSRRGGG